MQIIFTQQKKCNDSFLWCNLKVEVQTVYHLLHSKQIKVH